jgi:hypothetical protein
MGLISRRTFTKSAASAAFMAPISAFSASDAQTIFMMDAVVDIKRSAGMPATANDLKDFQTRRPERKEPELWGKVCIPVPFADFDYYYTDGGHSWFPNPGQDLPAVTVPPGFCTDLASIPQVFWSLGFPHTGRYAYAAIVHDFLYWTQTTTQLVADDVFLASMEDTQVDWAKRYALYGVLRAGFGRVAWNNNAAAKAAGVKRFLKVLPPRGEVVFWKDWSKDPSHFSD